MDMTVDSKNVVFTPIGYQGAAQHTYTLSCDGFHEPGKCNENKIQHINFNVEAK